MKSWLIRNKRYAVALFVIIQAFLVASYFLSKPDAPLLFSRIISPTTIPSDTEYLVAYTEDPYSDVTVAGRDLFPLYDLLFSRFLSFEKGYFQPDILRSWSMLSSEGEKQIWHLSIRDDVFFHNGRPLTREDILYSLAIAQSRIPALEKSSFTFLDDYTIEVTTSDPSLIMTLSSFFIVPREHMEGDMTGSGPFMAIADRPDGSDTRMVTLVPSAHQSLEKPRTTIEVEIFSSPHRFIARAVEHMKQKHVMTMTNIPAEYAPTFRQYCFVDESYDLQPLFFLKNRRSSVFDAHIDSIVSYVLQTEKVSIKNLVPNAFLLTQFASPGVQGYQPDITVFSSGGSAPETAYGTKLTAYASYDTLPILSFLAGHLNAFGISLDIIPVDESSLQEAIRQHLGDLYLVTYNYNERPTLASLYEAIFSDNGVFFTGLPGTETADRLIGEYHAATTIFNEEKVIKNMVPELTTDIGYPLFDRVRVNAVCGEQS